MPTPLPSSFASAAAGNTQDPSRRGDASTGGEWSRSRMNGATQTFRRPSVATNPSHTRDSSQIASASTPTASGAYVPPHLSSNTTSSVLRNGDARYSKEQLLELYKAQRDTGSLNKHVEDYFVADWDPHTVSTPMNGAWGKRDDHKTSAGPEVCWDHGGQAEPLGLTDMSDGEKELFSASVNSPLKPPPVNAGKENAGPGTTGRKSSISYTQGHINNYNTSSPNAARPGVRRRETGDSVGNPMSPTGTNTRFFRDEANTSTPPPALLRRKTDFRESNAKDDKPKEGGVEAASPFGSLKRSSTNPLNTAIGGPSSPWGAASASHNANFSPMGAFGAFSLGSNTAQTPTAEKKAGFGSLRGESRFKDLLSKEGAEDIAGSAKDKSLGNLERLNEEDSDKRAQSPWGDAVKTRASRSETNPFDEPRSGSAALGGSQDVEAPSQADLGFGAFGMTSSIPGFRELMHSQENSRNPTPSLLQGHEPTSPTNTNPYQSPHGDRTVADAEDVDTDGSDIQHPQHPGLSGLRDPSNPFGSMRRVGSGMDLPSIDRSQNSSVNANRNFAGLGGLGGLSGLGGPTGWPSSDAIGTPTRERSAFVGGFGDPIFGSMGGLQSPSLSTLGGGGLFSPHAGLSGTASIGRSSKLGALFSGMAEEQGRSDSVGLEQGDAQQAGQASKPGSNSASQTPVSAVGSIPANLTHDPTQAPTPSGSISAAQQRTMVMPDRMRWIYRDPQGNIQGPWTGLEMHDWFKAGFFSPDLQIKKLEDGEFEPLAQLVRRIGNSREPFLVPQIGIPHGPEPAPGQWQNTNQGSAQPPFPGSFPSFGTTLTAEQQNALERRKQEEQYLMARQKEHLAQQQAIMKQMQVPGAPPSLQPQLQHQSSAHSLHSQPSFGSITSPAAYQPSPIQAPIQGQQQNQGIPGFFDAAASLRQAGIPNVLPGMLGTELGSQDQLPALLERLNVGRQDPFAFGAAGSFSARQPDNFLHSQQVASMLQDRAQLQQEQADFEKANANDPFDQEAREERLRQFHALRAQEGELGMRTADGLPTHPAASVEHEVESLATDGVEETEPSASEPALTLSQQVHKAASAQRQQQQEKEQEQEQQNQSVSENAWGSKNDHAMPQPFPPPPSASPLPAPAAQRNRQYVAESLAAGSRSQTQTPIDAAPTSVAPWAKDTHEVPKGPSLKEIQEAEARTAAQREEIAAAARRAQLLAEQERLSQAQAQAVPGLPSSANWASAGSPATPSTAGSPWNSKSQPVQTNAATKKTLAQIQKEEEARKQRLASAAAAAAQTATPSPPASVTKRYADLASKAPAPVAAATVAPTASGAWTTVGAGGKAKVPPAAPLGPRSSSGTVPIAPAAAKPRPVIATRTSVGSVPQSNPNRAVEEFTKWAKLALGKGLNSNINVDDFVQQLLFLPAEAEIISDSVYANSQTLDGRRFAEEFIRRRKLADKGVVDPVSPSAFAEQKNGGGWSEVAKKGSAASTAATQQREEEASNAAFKVVAPRKKGKR
ncbi:GYF domain-containing protein mpd2 [Penicillium rolfsii]|nr:GYF domain-containing protein mpd2 [Penicillium rolfsii]